MTATEEEVRPTLKVNDRRVDLSEITVNGDVLDLAADPEACNHGGEFMWQPYVARILAEDGEGVDRWEVRVRAFCGDCSTPFEFDLAGPGAPRTPREPPGVVLTMRPIRVQVSDPA